MGIFLLAGVAIRMGEDGIARMDRKSPKTLLHS